MTKPKLDPGRGVCGAAKRQGTGTCQRSAGWGTDHVGIGTCKLHGGTTLSHRRSAQREVARQAVVTYGLPVDIDPFQALIEEIARTHGHVLWLRDRIAEMSPEDLIWGVSETEAKEGGGATGDYRSTTSSAGTHVWLTLYREERAHLDRLCRSAISAGIAERQARLDEQQGALITSVIQAALADAEWHLSPDQRAAAIPVISRHLRALPA